MATVLVDLSCLTTPVRLYGIGRYCRDLADGLVDEARDDLRIRSVTALPLVGPARFDAPLHADRFERHGHWAWRVRLRLAAAAHAAGADLVHSPHPGATPLGLSFLEPSCPRIVTCHDLIPLRYPAHYPSSGRRQQQLVEWRRYRSASHVIAISHATADDLMRLLDVPASRISVVHSGVDLTRWSSDAHSEDGAALDRHDLGGARFALYVGGDDWRKNFDGMLKALAALRKSPAHHDVKLVWAGRPAPGRIDAIRRLARELGQADAFVELGHVADHDLTALYRRAACLLFVSRCEGFGYPLVEAMASGCPVIASGTSSLAEVAGDAAVTVDPEAPAAIADAMRLLLDDPAERQRFVAAGAERARSFSVASMARATIQIYDQLLR